MSSVCLVPVRPLLSSVAVLYHVQASYKGPIQFMATIHQASESRMEKLPYGIKRSFHIVMLAQLIHNPNFKARMLLYLLLHFVWPFNFNLPKKGYTLSA